MSCLFCKILDGSIPSTRIYEDDQCIAFADIHPQAPVHLLIIPRKHITSLAEATTEEQCPCSAICFGPSPKSPVSRSSLPAIAW